jgi:hypothetical protein
MRPEQRIVAVGAASGVVLVLVSVWILTGLLPRPAITDTVAERLAYALKANMVAVVPLFVMIITIANSRFLSDAIDPLVVRKAVRWRSMDASPTTRCSRISCLP